MVADDPSLNEDASAQVAHAISTHAVQTEFDFYTAVDDWNQNEHAGAGMLGTIEFNSSTLYRYANVAVHEFMRKVGSVEAVINALSLFVKAFANSLPTGKVATFANQTLPEALLVSIRTDRPVSLVSAYEEPIKSKQGYVKASVKRLLEELHKADKFLEPAQVNILLSLDQNEFNDDIYEVMTLNDLLDNVSQELKTMLTEVGD